MEFKTTYIIFIVISCLSFIALLLDTHKNYIRGEYNPAAFQANQTGKGKNFIINMGLLMPASLIQDRQVQGVMLIITMSSVTIVTTVYNVLSIPKFIDRKKRIIMGTLGLNIFSLLLSLFIYGYLSKIK